MSLGKILWWFFFKCTVFNTHTVILLYCHCPIFNLLFVIYESFISKLMFTSYKERHYVKFWTANLWSSSQVREENIFLYLFDKLSRLKHYSFWQTNGTFKIKKLRRILKMKRIKENIYVCYGFWLLCLIFKYLEY